MPQTLLKPLRVLVSLIVLALIAAPFLDVQGVLPGAFVYWVSSLQLVPSSLRLLQGAGSAALGALLVLGATALFGRVYCSSICPLGTLQDLVSWAAGRLRRNRKSVRFRWTAPRNRLRYGLLAIALGAAAAGSLLPLVLLDPFSGFARAAALLARPVAAAGNNLMALGLESWGIYGLPPVEWRWAGAGALALAAAVPALALVMAWRRGRLFCNTICPVGALLALCAGAAPFKIRIDSASCTHCANCSVACKAGCIDLKRQRVDLSRCVACFDCIPVCPESGIRYGPSRTADPGPAPAPDRRRRLLVGGGLAWAAGLGWHWRPGRADQSAQSAGPPPDGAPVARLVLPQNRLPTQTQVVKTAPVAPPGAGRVGRFNGRCTACYLCVSACPTQTIQPALLAYGVAGLGQPSLDFSLAYCAYECVRCGEVCPTGAIAALAPAAKRRVRIGQVHFIESNCVVVTDRSACGACAEHCPTRAVRMVPYAQDLALTLPELDPEVCVGCGACEYACPVRPHKAIYVDGERVQGLAEAPRQRQPTPSGPVPGAGTGADFPF